MSRTYHRGERRIRVRGIRRETPDLSKLARALIELAQAQVEAEAQAEHRACQDKTRRRSSPRSRGGAA
jgi:hypothetical protein